MDSSITTSLARTSLTESTDSGPALVDSLCTAARGTTTANADDVKLSLPRLVVLDCHQMLWNHHREGTTAVDELAESKKWFYNAEWVGRFVRGCQDAGIAVGIASMLHDLHDGIPNDELRELTQHQYYDNSLLVTLPHDYDKWIGGRRLVQDVLKRHADVNIDLEYIETWMPPSGTPMLNKNDHLARLVARHNLKYRDLPAGRITSMDQVWLFDDNHANTTLASREHYTGITVLSTKGFTPEWFAYAITCTFSTEITMPQKTIIDLLQWIGLLEEVDALIGETRTVLNSATIDDDDEELGDE